MNLFGISRIFERYARQSTDYTRAVINLSVQYDLKPSVARERFEAFHKANPLLDWMTCARHLQQTEQGAQWMQEQEGG